MLLINYSFTFIYVTYYECTTLSLFFFLFLDIIIKAHHSCMTWRVHNIKKKYERRKNKQKRRKITQNAASWKASSVFASFIFVKLMFQYNVLKDYCSRTMQSCGTRITFIFNFMEDEKKDSLQLLLFLFIFCVLIKTTRRKSIWSVTSVKFIKLIEEKLRSVLLLYAFVMFSYC